MVGERRCSGKEFHVLRAATRKLRLPNSVHVDGTHRSPRCTERSLTLPPTSVSGVQMPQNLQKYEGQRPRTQSKAKHCNFVLVPTGFVLVGHKITIIIIVQKIGRRTTVISQDIRESLSISTPVHSPAAGECSVQHNEHRMRSLCSRCLTFCLVFTPAALCWWANNNNNNNSSYSALQCGRHPWHLCPHNL